MRRTILLLASRALVLFASGALIAGVQGQARALASHPPDAVLKHEKRFLQGGRLISHCWIDRCVDGFSSYPSAVPVDSGSRLHIRLSENRRPDRFSLTSSESPDGRSRRIDTTLRRVVRHGKTVAWDAYFRVERPDRHYYLGAFGIWSDNGGRVHGDAYWQFHVRTTS